MNYIAHHGVKGQKWGVRRYQNKDGSLTAAGKQRRKNNLQPYDADLTAKNFIAKNANRKVSELAGGEIADQLIPTAIAYTAMFGIMFAASKISERVNRSKKSKKLEELNRDKEIKSLKEAPKLSEKMSAAESAKITNPDFPSMGTTMNCTFCTTAMVLREKGYDVKASKLLDGWYSDDLFKTTFNSQEVKMKRKKSSSDVIKEFSSLGDDAYGNLCVTWKLGGAHSIFWKNENGTTNFYDGQSGKAYTSSKDKQKLFNAVVNSNIRYNRLDNCEPTEYALAVVESTKK